MIENIRKGIIARADDDGTCSRHKHNPYKRADYRALYDEHWQKAHDHIEKILADFEAREAAKS